jgi:hypothetical protein
MSLFVAICCYFIGSESDRLGRKGVQNVAKAVRVCGMSKLDEMVKACMQLNLSREVRNWHMESGMYYCRYLPLFVAIFCFLHRL